MKEAIWNRVGPATGVLFFALLLAGAVEDEGTAPTFEESTDATRRQVIRRRSYTR